MKTIKIKTDQELKNYFKNNSIVLKSNASLTFKDKIEIGNYIEFDGTNIFGENNKIQNNCSITNVKLGKDNLIKQNCIIENSTIKNFNVFGPFCFLRDFCKIGHLNKIGTFVEIKNSTLLNHNKLAHNIFLGDTSIKSHNIIGAGVITANYSKGKYNNCLIGNNTFIGCNTTIISPVKFGDNIIVGAGSTINFNIEKNTKVIQKNLNYFSK